MSLADPLGSSSEKSNVEWMISLCGVQVLEGEARRVPLTGESMMCENAGEENKQARQVSGDNIANRKLSNVFFFLFLKHTLKASSGVGARSESRRHAAISSLVKQHMRTSGRAGQGRAGQAAVRSAGHIGAAADEGRSRPLCPQIPIGTHTVRSYRTITRIIIFYTTSMSFFL